MKNFGAGFIWKILSGGKWIRKLQTGSCRTHGESLCTSAHTSIPPHTASLGLFLLWGSNPTNWPKSMHNDPNLARKPIFWTKGSWFWTYRFRFWLLIPQFWLWAPSSWSYKPRSLHLRPRFWYQVPDSGPWDPDSSLWDQYPSFKGPNRGHKNPNARLFKIKKLASETQLLASLTLIFALKTHILCRYGWINRLPLCLLTNH